MESGLTRVGAIRVVVYEEQADGQWRRAIDVVEAQHCCCLVQVTCSGISCEPACTSSLSDMIYSMLDPPCTC